MSTPTRRAPVGKSGLTWDNGNVSDPRNAPTFGGLAEQHLEEMFDMGSISPIHSSCTTLGGVA